MQRNRLETLGHRDRIAAPVRPGLSRIRPTYGVVVATVATVDTLT